MMTSKRLDDVSRAPIIPRASASATRQGSDDRNRVREVLLHAQLTLLSPSARPLRALLTGAVAALLQLFVLDMLLDNHWVTIVAAAVALLCGAQLNFVLSSAFTWRDRQAGGFRWPAIRRQWASYQTTIASTAVLNVIVYSIAVGFLPLPVATIVGNASAAIVNYVINDTHVFRRSSPT